MHRMKELKEKLCKELESYYDKELNTTSVASIDTLAHAIKNIDKIIEKHEEDQDQASYGMYDGRIMPRSAGNYVMGRGRDSMGRYTRGYSRNADPHGELADMKAYIAELESRLQNIQGM